MPLQRGEFPQKFATTKKVADQLERLQFPLFNFFKNSIIVHLQKQHTIHTVHTVLYVNCWVHCPKIYLNISIKTVQYSHPSGRCCGFLFIS